MMFIRKRLCHIIPAWILFMLTSSTMVSQVKIQEKIQINPAPLKTLDEGQTLRIDFSYSGGLAMGGPRCGGDYLIVSGPCFNNGQDYWIPIGGTASWSVQACSGTYTVVARLCPTGDGVDTITAWFGGKLIGSWPGSVSCPEGDTCLYLPSASIIFYTLADLLAWNSTLGPCQSTNLRVKATSESGATPVFDPATQDVALTITSGSEFAAFVAGDGSLSSQTTLHLQWDNNTWDYTSLVSLGAKDSIPSGDHTVTVEADVNGISKLDTLTVSNPPPHHLDFDYPPYSLISGGQTPLGVIERNEDGSERSCDDYRLITVQVDSTRYGHLIDTANQVVQGNSLTVLYKDARSGRVQFAADGTIPDTMVTFAVTASTPGSTNATTTISVDHPPDSTLISVSPAEASPGDTVSIIVQRKRWDCQVFPCPDDARFFVDLYNWDDLVFGKFLSPETGDSGDYLWCVPQGFKFVVATDTVPADPNYEIEFLVQPRVYCVPFPPLPGVSQSPSTGISKKQEQISAKSKGSNPVGAMVPLGPRPDSIKAMVNRWRSERMSKLKASKLQHQKPKAVTSTCPQDQGLKIATGCEPQCPNAHFADDRQSLRVDNQTICNNLDYGVTDPALLPEQFLINVCYSTADKRWEPTLTSIVGNITWGLCTSSRGNPIDINYAFAPEVTKDNYQLVTENLEIERDYFSGKDYTYQPYFKSTGCVLTHEFEHTRQLRNIVQTAVEGKSQNFVAGGLVQRLKKIFEPKRLPCDQTQAAMLMKQQIDNAKEDFIKEYNRYIEKLGSEFIKINNGDGKKILVSRLESPAIIAALDCYNSLIRQIRNRFK